MTTAPSIDALVTNVERGGLTGIKPSASGLAVVDLDEGGDEGKEAILRILGKPLLAVPSSQPGRWHLYYRCPDAANLRKRQWSLGIAKGEIIVGNNAAVMWSQGEVLDMLANPPDDSTVSFNIDALPRVRKRDVMAKGNRNNALNARAYSAGQRGNVVELEAVRLEAKAAGLPLDEIEGTSVRAFDDGNAKILSSDQRGLEQALRSLGIDLCFDLRAIRDEIKRGDGAWQLLTDRNEAALWEEIAGRSIALRQTAKIPDLGGCLGSADPTPSMPC